jgi:hypothetical protein
MPSAACYSVAVARSCTRSATSADLRGPETGLGCGHRPPGAEGTHGRERPVPQRAVRPLFESPGATEGSVRRRASEPRLGGSKHNGNNILDNWSKHAWLSCIPRSKADRNARPGRFSAPQTSRRHVWFASAQATRPAGDPYCTGYPDSSANPSRVSPNCSGGTRRGWGIGKRVARRGREGRLSETTPARRPGPVILPVPRKGPPARGASNEADSPPPRPVGRIIGVRPGGRENIPSPVENRLGVGISGTGACV